jgi:DnaK suppressor protein
MTKTATTTKSHRSDELRKMLKDRLYELTRDVHGRIREARVDSSNERRVIDQGETSELDVQDELEFALLQMNAETLNKIDVALRKLAEGTYGCCVECGDDIGVARLGALPFAVRCRDCEENRELTEQRERNAAQRRTVSVLFD